MNKYILSCESACDLNKEYLEKYDIKYLPFHYFLDDDEYADDYDNDKRLEVLYSGLEKNKKPRTTQIAVSTYEEYFKKYLEQGYDIIHVTLSSGITGTYNAATIAKEELKRKYPNQKIIVVDGLCASSGYGLLMVKLAELKQNGASITDLYYYAEENKRKIHHWFFSTDLKYYFMGGRVSRASYFFGSLLRICPMLIVDNNGKLQVVQKIRTAKSATEVSLEKMNEFVKDGKNYNDLCYISHSNCEDLAINLKEKIEAVYPNLKGKIQIFDIGPTIGAHAGPGTVALFFIGSKRYELKN